MDIRFWLTTNVDLSKGLDRPLGGAEISAVQLACVLSLFRHSVTIYCQTDSSYVSDGVTVKPYECAWDDDIEYLIVVRAHPILNLRTKRWLSKRPRHVVCWSGDAFDQSSNQIFWDTFVCDTIDAFVCKSEWQRETLIEHYPRLFGKTFVIHNGVERKYFSDDFDHDPNFFVHASTFYRGAPHFLKLWPKIKEVLPDARLRMYIRTSLYVDDNPQDKAHSALFDELSKLRDVELCNPVPQKRLIEELGRARLMLYPNDYFVESSCGVAQQSIIAGTPVITSARAGLPETVGDCGYCISGDPSSDAYQSEFIARTYELCTNTTLWQELSDRGKRRLHAESWESTAGLWIDFLSYL